MDTEQEAIEYNTMDHSAVNRTFVDDLLRLVTVGSRVLDVGTGTALIPLELCSRGKQWRPVAVDLAQAMLDVAAKNVAAAKLEQAIELKLVDAKRLPFEDGEFAVVMSNSIIHHIPDPADCLKEMVRVVSRDSGLLFVRDLLRPNSESQLQHLVETYAADADEHQQRMFGESLHAALTLDEIRALAGRFGITADCIQQTTDRHWTLSWRRR
jgi:ubiquinone/menaquinone biosynthesis C-methylase UbiE